MTIEVTIKALIEVADNPTRSLDELNAEVTAVISQKFEHFTVVSHKEADEPLNS